MFNLFNKKPKSEGSQLSAVSLQLTGMHCSSCAVNIDLSLEELSGVINSKTNYARSTSQVEFDPNLTDPQSIISLIESLGYSAKLIS